ncbi:hypothetical protein FGO68_gene15251 [Halteria grandinella]|uniref:Uncharacterized protein n=1 Tax=Halteria grandinella TaxID=5974 RepID=A0A8J8T1U5_HALGN|nr:hypothetical protein FGO68_gene15251 [Halteria grandinella]
MSLYEGMKMLDPTFSISILCEQNSNCSQYSLTVTQAPIWNLSVSQKNIFTGEFIGGRIYGANCECEIRLMDMQIYVDYLNTTASAYPAVQINEDKSLLTLTNSFRVYTNEKKLEFQGQRIHFPSVQLLEGGKMVNKTLVKQVYPQNGKILPDLISSYYIWTMNIAQFNVTAGILGKSFEFGRIHDQYQRRTYIDLDDIDYFEFSLREKGWDEMFYQQHHLISFNRRVVQTEMAPDSIFSGLAQIGGLTGLALIFKFMAAYQERNFEQNIKKTQGGKVGLKSNLLKAERKKEGSERFWRRITQIRRPTVINDETQEEILEDIEEGQEEAQECLEVKEFFSIEMFKSMHDNIAEMKEKINAQEKEIKILKANKDF